LVHQSFSVSRLNCSFSLSWLHHCEKRLLGIIFFFKTKNEKNHFLNYYSLFFFKLSYRRITYTTLLFLSFFSFAKKNICMVKYRETKIEGKNAELVWSGGDKKFLLKNKCTLI